MELSIEQLTYGRDVPKIDMTYKTLKAHIGDSVPRFYMAYGANFGHQASTLHLLKRLIALDVVKRAEIVYQSEETLDKLRQLLPQLGGGDLPASLDISSGGKTASVTLIHAKAITEASSLAISGGWDYRPKPTDFMADIRSRRTDLSPEERSLAEQAKKLPILEDEIAALKSDVVIAVQPFTWEAETTSVNSFVYSKAQKRVHYLGEKIKNIEYMFLKRPKPQIAPEDWDTLSRLPGKAEVVEAAKAVLDGVRGKLLFCPVYGIADGVANTRNSPPVTTVLFNLAGTIRMLQQEKDPRFRRGAVILLLRDLKSETWGAVTTRFGENANDSDAVLGVVRDHLQTHGKAKVIVRQAAKDRKAISDAIGALGDDEVLILSLSGLPQDVFDLMYAEATLPSLFEGAATASLAISLGIPYIRFSAIPYPVLPLGEPPTDASKAALAAATAMATAPKDWPTKGDTPPKILADYVLDAYDATKPQHQYYADLGAHLQKHPEQDKLTATLMWAVDQEMLG